MKYLAVLLFVATACSHSAPSADNTGPLTTLVPQRPSAYAEVTVAAGASGVPVVVPPSLVAGLAPLVAAKTFAPQALEPLNAYGLDHPVAKIQFSPGPTLIVGGTDFDAHGFYVQRPGDPDVYLVLSAPIRPVLALAGVVTPAPA